MRAMQVDAASGIGLLKCNSFLSLIPVTYRQVISRIPHQSAARTSHADSFSPGEAMAPFRAL